MPENKGEEITTFSARDQTLQQPKRTRGRPKGTKNTHKMNRKLISMRFSQEILELIQEGSEGIGDSFSTSKTDFVEQAIRYYYSAMQSKKYSNIPMNGRVQRGGRGNPVNHEPLNEAADIDTEINDIDQLIVFLSDRLLHEERKGNDFVDVAVESWERERPDRGKEWSSSYAVFARILRAAQYLDAAEAQIINSFGLSVSEYRLITTIKRSGPPYRLSPTQIIETLLITPGAITKQVDRISKLGLVTRYADSRDRRSILIGLTPQGIELLDKINMNSHANGSFQLLNRSLKPEEKQVISWLLRKILITLEREVDALRRDSLGRGKKK